MMKKIIKNRADLLQKINELEFESQLTMMELKLKVQSLPYQLLNQYSTDLLRFVTSFFIKK